MKNKALLRLAHLTFWSTYLVIYTWVFSHFMTVNASLFRGLANGLPLLVIVYINIWSINRFFEKKQYIISVIIAFILFMVMIPVRLLINDAFPDANIGKGLVSSYDSNKIGITVTNLLFITLSSFYQILVNRFRKERFHTKEIQVHQEAQLDYLKAQINPHFLFNTLNNIYSLAVQKSDKTPEMVVRLSHLLRYVVYESQEKMVALSKEINHIKEYIDLFNMRSMPEPNIRFRVLGDTNGLNIGPMILIPLVENCCKHCDFDTNDEAFALITLKITEKHIIFKTQNTFSPTATKDKVGGVGLVNIRKRLEMIYGTDQNLETSEIEDTFIVKLSITKQ